MKLPSIVKTAVITSILLLSVGMGAFWYFNDSDNKKEAFNLYQLVPSTAKVVFDTDNFVEVVQGINGLQCSSDGHFLYISQLFSYLKEHVNTLSGDAPHGLSKELNKMLISFHDPFDKQSQVFYFCLGKDDYDFLQLFIRKYSLDRFPARAFDYKGEEIKIYSMPDDNFLACYSTPDFLAVSYQKKLIEEVIDARREKKSILADSLFLDVYPAESIESPATIYLRADMFPGSWSKFGMMMNSHAIYFSGINKNPGSCLAYMNVTSMQEPVKGFPGDILPSSTFTFNRRSAGDVKGNIFHFLPPETPVTTCLFHSGDSLRIPYMVAAIPVGGVSLIGRRMRNLVETNSAGLQEAFEQLTGVPGMKTRPYYRFYNDYLLLAPDFMALSAYTKALDKKRVLSSDDDMYVESIAGLSDSYHFMVMADIDELFAQDSNYRKLIPDFFLHNKDFFRHFMISAQFSYSEEAIHPNIVLVYEEGE